MINKENSERYQNWGLPVELGFLTEYPRIFFNNHDKQRIFEARAMLRSFSKIFASKNSRKTGKFALNLRFRSVDST